MILNIFPKFSNFWSSQEVFGWFYIMVCENRCTASSPYTRKYNLQQVQYTFIGENRKPGVRTQ